MTSLPLDTLRPLYAFCDPHGGQAGPQSARLKRVASHAAICVGGMDWLGRIFILSAWSGRVTTDELIERMYQTHADWGVKTFGGEANGLQALFQDAVLRDARVRNRALPLVKVFQPTHQEKDFRIRTTLQPLVGNGRLVIVEDAVELVAQMTAFPLSPQKDLIDCAASLCRLIPPRPIRLEHDQETQAKLDYLTRTGASDDVLRETRKTGRFPDRAFH